MWRGACCPTNCRHLTRRKSTTCRAKEGSSMRRAVGFLSTVIVPVFVATMAFAADPYGSEPGAGSERGSGHSHEQGATSGTSSYMGEHTMTGRITDIDKEKGRVKVDAQGEKLDLRFPQSALRNLNE